jgi:hypothetical protein
MQLICASLHAQHERCHAHEAVVCPQHCSTQPWSALAEVLVLIRQLQRRQERNLAGCSWILNFALLQHHQESFDFVKAEYGLRGKERMSELFDEVILQTYLLGPWHK